MSSSRVSSAGPGYLALPALQTPPIPAAGTSGGAVIYCDAALGLLQSTNGAAYAALGGGGGGSLNAAYLLGNQITLTDAAGVVTLASSAMTTGGGAMLITQGAMAMAAPFVALQIDGGATTTGANALTGLNIDYSLVTGAGLVQGIVYTGPSTTTAKTKGQAALVLNSRASAMSSFQNRVRNKKALTGSIWGLSWDDVNFEGATAASVLDGQTHLVTLDAITNVDALTNNAEVVGINVMTPESGAAWLPTNGAITVLSRAKNQGAFTAQVNTSGGGGAIVYVGYEAATTILSNMFGVVYDFSPAIGGANQYISMLVKGPSTSATSSILLQSQTRQSAGTVWQHNQEVATALSGAFQGFYLDFQTNVDATAGHAFAGLTILTPNATHASAAALAVTANPRAGYGLNLAMTPDAAGSAVKGALITVSGNASNAGYALRTEWGATGGGTLNSLAINAASTAGSSLTTLLRLGAVTTTCVLSGTELVGLDSNLSTLFTPGATTVIAGRFAVGATTRTDVTGEAAVVISNASETYKSLSIQHNLKTGQACRIEYLNTPTQTGDVVILNIDGGGLVPGAFKFTGLTIGVPAVTGAGANGSAALSVNSSATKQRSLDLRVRNTEGIVAMVSYLGTATTTNTLTLLNLAPGTSHAVTLGALLSGVNLDLTSNITPGANAILGYGVYVGASSSGSTRPILVSSTQIGNSSFGIEVEMTPGSAASVGGIYVKMGANSSGAAIAITQAGTGAGIAFGSADSGGLGHIQGPAGGSLLIKAGPRSGAGNGRAVEVYGSDGVTAGAGGNVLLTPGAGVGGSADGGVLVGSSLPCYLEMYEMTAPAAGAANTARLFSQDNGAGKTQLMVQFGSGVAQQIAIEP